MEHHQPKYDELGLAKEPTITQTLEPGEHIEMTCKINKWNRFGLKQERTLMITNRAVYNLSKLKVKRKIMLGAIHACTLSKKGIEFVLHVPSEYDYRYGSKERRDLIMETLNRLYPGFHGGKPLPFYLRDEADLEDFTTTKSDAKKGVSRMPKDTPITMPASVAKPEERKSPERPGATTDPGLQRTKTKTIFSKKGHDVCLEDFKLLKVLGRGAFGKVMLVEKNDTKEMFAIKSLKKEEIIQQEQLENTKTEKMILEAVAHPFLVGLEYCFQTPEKIFFVMNFMKGGELFQHLRHVRKFDESRVKFYACQLALGLGHLHSHDIVYRDLKPENVLLDELGNAALTDFGMAKVVKKNETTQTFCGTPEYLSPEIIQMKGHNKNADWWSFGVLLYEMLYGIPPFYSQNQNVMYQMILKDEPSFPITTSVSDEGKDLIKKFLIKDPSKRLGATRDIDEIKEHPWFSTVNWADVIAKRIPPPFKPDVAGSAWLKNFDSEFTSEQPINSFVPANNDLLNQFSKDFEEFDHAKKV